MPRVPIVNPQFGSNSRDNNQVTITVNIDNNGQIESSLEQQIAEGRQFGQMIQAKVIEILAKERRAGGMLSH